MHDLTDSEMLSAHGGPVPAFCDENIRSWSNQPPRTLGRSGPLARFRRALVTAAMTLAGIGLAACGGGGGSSGNETGNAAAPQPTTNQSAADPGDPNAKVSDMMFFSEPSNPLLLSYRPNGGAVTTYYGTKDDSGTALSVNGMFTQADSAKDPAHRLEYDTQGRPVKAYLGDGSTIDFKWDTATKFSIVVTTANGQATSPLTLDAASQKQSVSPGNSEAALAADIKSSALHPAITKAQAAVSNSQLLVNVRQNGVPQAGASVFARIVPVGLGSGHPGYRLPLTETGPGQYSAGFANFPSSIPPDQIDDKCRSVMSVVKDSCKALTPISAYMTSAGCVQAAALAAGIATPATGVAVMASCESVFADAATGCNGASAAEAACNAVVATVKFADPDGVDVTATATKQNLTGTASTRVPGRAPQATLDIALPAVKLIITPDAPTVAPNNTLQLTAKATGTNGAGAAVPTGLTWSTSDSAVATVNTTGLVAGKTRGQTSVSVKDPVSGSAASVMVTVTGGPECRFGDAGGTRDERSAFMIVANDGTPCFTAGGNALVRTIIRAPQHGTAVVDGGRYRYTPNPGFVGQDNFDETETFADGTALVHWSVTVTAP